MWKTLENCIPNDHSNQVGSEYYVKLLMKKAGKRPAILDLGCGIGRSIDIFKRHRRSVDWHGVDIETSPEVDARIRTDGTFYTYNGVDIPFADGTFDIVFSHQVFEHVRFPERLLKEVRRVLRPDGAFIGSVSSLEPYHSYSYWSFTPFGWHTLLVDAGMTPVEFRPGIDAIALITRLYRGRPPEAGAWFKKSPLNKEIDDWRKRSKRRHALANLRKLQFCGHLVFYAEPTHTGAG